MKRDIPGPILFSGGFSGARVYRECLGGWGGFSGKKKKTVFYRGDVFFLYVLGVKTCHEILYNI